MLILLTPNQSYKTDKDLDDFKQIFHAKNRDFPGAALRAPVYFFQLWGCSIKEVKTSARSPSSVKMVRNNRSDQLRFRRMSKLGQYFEHFQIL